MIIVTGAAGFIGSRLVTALALRDIRQPIVGIEDREAEGVMVMPNVWGLIDWRHCWSHLDDWAHEITAVYHLGAITDTTCTDVRALDEQNTIFTMKLWRWCAEHQKPIVYASSAATYGDGSKGFSERAPLHDLVPLNRYGLSKHLVDISIEDAKEFLGDTPPPPAWYGLKFFNVYGPGEQHKGKMQSFVTKSVDAVMSGQKLKLFGNARSSTRDFVYVDDVVDAMLWLMEARPESGLYNVGTGDATSFLRVVTSIIDQPWLVGSITDWVELIDMPDELRGRYQHHTQADISKLRAAGYQGRFRPVVEGIEAYVREATKASSTRPQR